MYTSMILEDRYKLLREIGNGSEGKVYLVFQESVFRFFAAKEIDKYGECYTKEGIEIWKRLKHKNLPEIQDVFETEDKIWIIMEYIDGTSLEDLIRAEKKIPQWISLYWSWKICNILEYLHEQRPSVIFGDLKAENVIIRKGEPVLIDLGSVHLEESRTKRTGSILIPDKTTITGVKRDIYCLGILVQNMTFSKKGMMNGFIRKALSFDQDGFLSVRQCKKELKHLILSVIGQGILMLAGVILLLEAGKLQIQEIKKQEKTQQYEELIHTAREKSDKECFIKAIYEFPEKEEAYLEYLDFLLKDLSLSKEEYGEFLTVWNHVLMDDKNCGEHLEEKMDGFATVVYRIGMSCWYFYPEREGTYLALNWFEKLDDYPEELRKNSEIYKWIGQYRNKQEILQRTEGEDRKFTEYLKEMRKLKMEKEELYFQLMMYKEELLFVVHYMAELQNEGMKAEEMERLTKEIQLELSAITDQRDAVKKQIGEIGELLVVVEEMKERIYEKTGDNIFDMDTGRDDGEN